MRPPAAGKHPPEKYEYRRSSLRDALDMQGFIMNCAKTKQRNAAALSALALALCRLLPLVASLRGKPLFIHGTITKRSELSPKEAMRMLKSAKVKAGNIDVMSMIDAGEPAEPTKPEKPSKESLSQGQG